MSKKDYSIVRAAVEAHEHGFTPVPIKSKSKRPHGVAWGQVRYETAEQVREAFEKVAAGGDVENIGLALGRASGGLIDVDFDHPKALRLRDLLLPPSPMETGRPGRPRSHRWFKVVGDIPQTRQYLLPPDADGGEKRMAVEFRSTGGQTLIPPSIWVDKDNPVREENYLWEGEPWGGEAGPAEIDGQVLATQVALVGLGTVLLEKWPKRGGRHAAYLALAGGLLRWREDVHPFWEKNLPVLIGAIADATDDEEGPRTRIAETMASTRSKLLSGEKVAGFGKLAEIIGEDHAEFARRYARDVEALAGFVGEEITREADDYLPVDVSDDRDYDPDAEPAGRDPLAERVSTWASVDLAPYLAGDVELPKPAVLTRSDGESLFYEGCVNSLFGMSESAKSWIAMWACIQEMAKGSRALYIDFEDMPATALSRMKLMGAADDDLRVVFRYVHPEEPISDIQQGRYSRKTDRAKAAHDVFVTLLNEYDPTLVVVDGMTRLYGMHGLETNGAADTDVITSWLTSVTRGGRTTVIVIDHTGKTGGKDSSPLGAHHKVAMVQGTAIRADAVDRPARGRVGKIELTVFKDRHGEVRSHSSGTGKEQCAGYFILDSTEEDMVRVSIAPPDPKKVTVGDSPEAEKKLSSHVEAQQRADEVLHLFGDRPDRYLTTQEVIAITKMDRDLVYAIWNVLENLGEVVRMGSTRWTKFRLRKEGEQV